MAGLSSNTPVPTEIKLHSVSRLMEISFSDGARFELPFELLRVYSPSAEVRGHGPGQEVLQTGKKEIGIASIEPAGSYGIKPLFTDGHDTGIYSWSYLYDLGTDKEELWAEYIQRLEQAGASREAGSTPDPKAPVCGDDNGGGGGGCGHHH
jgi:DUF971 family protein